MLSFQPAFPAQLSPGVDKVAEKCAAQGANTLSEALPKAEWRSRPCNPSHRVLAQLAKEGLVSELVTTNWDTLIEHALRSARIPFTPVVNHQLLREGGRAAGVRLAKIHGCIDHTEQPLRATTDELRQWSADWARVLFEYLARTSTFVFVGYSGSAQSVTVTLAAVATADDDASRDYVVDPRGLLSIGDTDHGREFVAALGGDNARAVEMTSSDFFSTLRLQIFPYLLERPLAVCRTQLSTLCEPTAVDPRVIESAVEAVFEAWKRLGPDSAQVLLPAVLPGFVKEPADHPYMPIVPTSEPLALVWLVCALMLWAGVAALDQDVLRSTVEVGADVEFVVMAAGMARRDVAAISGVSDYVETHETVDTGIVGVVLGDMGPLPEPQFVNPSVARPQSAASVVRPGGPRCVWLQAADLLSVFGKDEKEDAGRARILEIMRGRAGAL